MSVYGRGNHTGSESRRDYYKRQRAFAAGEIPHVVDYSKTLDEVLAALDEGEV